jgi:hypothetical protein
MSLQHEPEQVANSGLGEETSKLLIEAQGANNNNKNNNNNVNLAKLQKAQSYSCSSNGPTASSNVAGPNASSTSALVTQQSLASGTSNKPVLIRQDRTTSAYLASPQLSALGTSEDTSDDDATKTISYQLMPNAPTNRCRTCHTHERRSSVSPSSVIHMPRSQSKESLGRLSSSSVVHQHSTNIPPVLITSSPTNTSRVIRQSSQPESSTLSCCNHSGCTHAQQTSSLRQLRDVSDPIAGIGTEILRVSFFS